MSGLLAGFRVVEFANLVAGPYAGMLLADLGAEVIKVEPPGGDLARWIGPFREGGHSRFFASVNRGKRSVVLDLGTDGGRRAGWDLCLSAQVVVHNLRPGAMERAGLGPDPLRAARPALVYCAISGFGGSGPEATRPGVDLIFQGESGMLSINGEPGSGPERTATTVGDYLAGTHAALAVTAALAGGRGATIDVSLRDGLIAIQGVWNSLYFHTGSQPERTGTGSPFLVPSQVFDTADGHLTLGLVSDRHYQILCEALGLEVDHRANEDRLVHRQEVVERLGGVLRHRTTAEWLTLLAATGLPMGRVMSLPEVFADPQVQARRMRVELGEEVVTGSPFWVDRQPAVAGLPPPELGAHTAEVLSELGRE